MLTRPYKKTSVFHDGTIFCKELRLLAAVLALRLIIA